MYVVHWTHHSHVDRITRTGLTPQRRELIGGTKISGIWVFPYGFNRTVNANWRKTLKQHRPGNYNGIVFRLTPDDFPLWAGDFIDETHPMTASARCTTLKQLHGRVPTNAAQLDCEEMVSSCAYWSFEIILTRRVSRSRIERILKDRPGRCVLDLGPRIDED